MMDPVFPVSRVTQQTPVQLSQLGGPAQEERNRALGEKFQALMNGEGTPVAPQHAESSGPSQIGSMIQQQDVQFAKAIDESQALSEAASSMPTDKLIAAEMHVMGELTEANVEVQIKTGVVQSSKGAVETLMKNQ